MKRNYLLFLLAFTITNFTFGQTVSDLINQVSQSGIEQMVRDLSGENTTTVGGNTVTIQHRVSSQGNNLAADYISERLISYGLNVSAIDYSTGGRNIVAIQLGTVNPNNIYIISAHYDSVTDHGADDNASGVAAVMESARILSNYGFENTIIYALWDEEEQGLIGAANYANDAAANSANILAVLNMDMIGYDGDNDKLFDIDVRNIANSYQIRDDLINIVSTHNIDLISNVVDPGTSLSDHGAFWSAGYSSLLLGEAWSTNDKTPGYHNINDRINIMNLDYFQKMVKLCVGYITTKGVITGALGVNEFDKLPATLYPNPTNGELKIEFGRLLKGKLTVFDLYGKSVLEQKIQGNTLEVNNLEGLSNGAYIFRIVDDEGNTANIKVVKQ